jgi:hypothetical protein
MWIPLTLGLLAIFTIFVLQSDGKLSSLILRIVAFLFFDQTWDDSKKEPLNRRN